MTASTLVRTAGTTKRPAPQGPATAIASLLLTADDRLADAVAALAAAAGHPLRRITTPGDAATHWQRAPLVVVGADAADECLAYGLPERPDLILATTLAWMSAEPEESSLIWPMAVKLRAEHVLALPEANEWLLDRFTRTTRSSTPAPVVATVAGHGGAGATTLALAGATAAAREGKRVVLIDLDPTGGGIDVAAGLEAQSGWRWPSLATGTGQLEPERLLSGLPQRGGLHLIGPDPRNRVEPGAEAFEQVLRAARIGADLVVIDLPRTRTAAAARAAAAAESVAVAIGHSTRSWEAARSVVAEYCLHTSRIGAVRRDGARPRPEPPRDGGLFDEFDMPEWGAIPSHRRLPEHLSRGRLPRGRTTRRLNALMTELGRARPHPDDTLLPELDLAGAAR
ncbi:CpaE-like family protein [Glycomyces tarimensis]